MFIMENGEKIKILLVEDDPDEVFLTLEFFNEKRIFNEVEVVSNGEEALAFLFRQGCYANKTPPGLILLDLNMPKIDGYEVLKVVKGDENLRKIPVIIVTALLKEDLISSDAAPDGYMNKPVNDAGLLMNILKSIDGYHFDLVSG